MGERVEGQTGEEKEGGMGSWVATYPVKSVMDWYSFLVPGKPQAPSDSTLLILTQEKIAPEFTSWPLSCLP